MTGLCGWLGDLRAKMPPRKILDDMVGGLPPYGDQARHDYAEAGAGLHVQGWDNAGCALHVEDDLWAAIEGEPRWTSAALAGIAADNGQAAALCEAYRRYGRDLFAHLRGPFSLAVIEPKARRALLAIDRLGIHTLCYVGAPGAVAFGSTTQAVRRHPSVESTITPQEIYDYLFYFVCPAPKTIYREQRKLLPAQFLWIEDGRTTTDFYWRMPYRDDRAAREEDLAEELMALLEQAVRASTEGEDEAALGAFLSGGLDSSTVAGVLGRVKQRRPKTFTVTFEDGGYDESSYARIVARHFDAEHHEVRLTPRDALDLMPKAAETYDEPFGNSSAIPTHYCARLARDHGVRTMLAGDGGDEIFAGNSRYVEQMIFDVYRHVPTALRTYVVEPVVFGLPFAQNTRLFRKARNYIDRARLPMPDRLEVFNPWRSIPLAEVFELDALPGLDFEQPLAIRREIYERAASPSLLQRMMHLDLTAALADSDLRKVNRMCGLAGMRVRYPLLNEDLVEFSARVPPRLLVKRFRLRDFYKRALRSFLPGETLSKKKHGFGMPFDEWLKTDPELRALAQDSLRAFRHRRLMRQAFLDEVIEQHGRPQKARRDDIVWDIVMLELWMQAHSGSQEAAFVAISS